MVSISKMKHLSSGECADIYEIDNETVLKLGKVGWERNMLYQEYINGKIVNDCKIPAPKVYDFIEMEGRYGYTMEKLKNTTLLDMFWKHPFKIISYAKKMATIQANIHSIKVSNGLPSLVDKYQDFIKHKSGIDESVKSLIFEDIKKLYNTSSHCICHGDFHPINIMVNQDKYFVIDWVLATIGPSESDVAGTYLITKFYSSNSRKGNIFKRFISAIGGKIIASVYLKEYISITGMEKKEIMKWIPIRAATYIDVGLSPYLEKKFKQIINKKYHLYK